jgi:hypothetical protein
MLDAKSKLADIPDVDVNTGAIAVAFINSRLCMLFGIVD